MTKKLYLGIMSGTSLDGIDIALCEIDSSSCTLVSSHEYPYPKELKEKILNIINSSTTLQEIGTLDVKLGTLYADAINDFLIGIDVSTITAIGLHGQTLWHNPNSESPFSMQLGSPNVVSAATGIKVVSDFRNMDIANGGEGAPFAPAFHQFVFNSLKEKTAVVNIGGMANITILGDKLRGWDSGCGNVLLDMWMMQSHSKSYDRDGAFAKSGKVHQALLDVMLSDAYFKKLPPKSTGREYFNAEWLDKKLTIFQNIKSADIQRTLLELTALSIVNDIKKTDTELIILCGGGSKNSFLMQRVQELSNLKVASSDEYGVSSDFMEAMAFAWLAYKRVNNQEVDLKTVTGAKKNSILGGIYG